MSDKSKEYLIYSIFLVGIIGHLIDYFKELILWLTPIALFVSGLLVISKRWNDKRFLTWLAIVFILTLSIEIVGVKTGFIFGSYTYGDTLGLKVLDTPLIIGLNWAIVIWGAIQVALMIGINNKLLPYFAGTIAVIFDFVLEPVAARLDYWTWDGGNIPLQNYIAWGIISILFSYLFLIFKVQGAEKLPRVNLTAQFIFFLFVRWFT